MHLVHQAIVVVVGEGQFYHDEHLCAGEVQRPAHVVDVDAVEVR